MAATKIKPTGRPKGVKNKTSGTAKENIIAVFTRMGGTAQMAKWARANESEFYRIYARLIPTEVTTPPGQPLQIELDPQPETIGKYHERLAQIAADRASRRPARIVGGTGVPPPDDGERAREG